MKKFLLTRPSRDVTSLTAGYIRGKFISTHTSLAGRDMNRVIMPVWDMVFLLTRPSRDVTTGTEKGRKRGQFLLTRPSRDVTPL